MAYSESEKEDRRTAVARVTQAHRGSLVNVLVKRAAASETSRSFSPFAAEKSFELRSQGSGVVIRENGLALSNWHVVDSAMNRDGTPNPDYRVEVTMPDGREFDVKVLSTSAEDDLALLALQLPQGETLKPVPLGDSDAIKIGERVLAIGNPLGLQFTVTAGIVRAR